MLMYASLSQRHIKNRPITKMTENFYFNREFSDFEELAENLRQWNIQIRQLQRKGGASSLRQLSLGNVLIACGVFSGRTHQIGVPPAGRTIAFHAGKGSQIVWRRREVPQNGLMIFPSDTDLDIVTKGPQNIPYTLTVTDDLLASRFENTPHNYYELISRHEVICIPNYSIKKLQRVFDLFFQATEEQPELLESKAFQAAIEERLLNEVSQALSSASDVPRQQARKSKTRTWKEIERVIEEAIESPIPVTGLCKAADVSERTLRRMFHERFGISPKAYLNRIRLNGIRHNLKKSSPGEVKITDVAATWGFWHMGQFTADYKNLFGELPSTTLLKK